MRQLLLVLIIFFAFFLPGISQSNDSLKTKRMTITTSLTSYPYTLDLNLTKFNVGSEIYVKGFKSIYVNVAYVKSLKPANFWYSTTSKSTKGIKVEAEGRYYLNKHKIFKPAILLFWPHIFQFKTQMLQNTGYYAATNIYYQKTKTVRTEYPDVINGSTSVVYQHDYTVERNVIDLDFRFGYQCIRKKGLTLDYAVGFGGKFISSNSPDKFTKNNDLDFFSSKLFDSGNGFAPTAVYQFRIGWAF